MGTWCNRKKAVTWDLRCGTPRNDRVRERGTKRGIKKVLVQRSGCDTPPFLVSRYAWNHIRMCKNLCAVTGSLLRGVARNVAMAVACYVSVKARRWPHGMCRGVRCALSGAGVGAAGGLRLNVVRSYGTNEPCGVSMGDGDCATRHIMRT